MGPMGDLVLTVYDWVPPPPRGLVRDLRVRWALEEAALPYRVATTPFGSRGPEHFAHQAFGQIPWLTDGDISIFESGAILLHLGELSETLMPRDDAGRAEVQTWVFAALNSVEMAALPWVLVAFSGAREGPEFDRWDSFLKVHRLAHLEPVLKHREWLVGDQFSIADLLMADVLRALDRFEGLAGFPECRAYVARATARPAYIKAHADQIAQYEAADRAGLGSS